jgi:hypothetical protein
MTNDERSAKSELPKTSLGKLNVIDLFVLERFQKLRSRRREAALFKSR